MSFSSKIVNFSGGAEPPKASSARAALRKRLDAQIPPDIALASEKLRAARELRIAAYDKLQKLRDGLNPERSGPTAEEKRLNAAVVETEGAIADGRRELAKARNAFNPVIRRVALTEAKQHAPGLLAAAAEFEKIVELMGEIDQWACSVGCEPPGLSAIAPQVTALVEMARLLRVAK